MKITLLVDVTLGDATQGYAGKTYDLNDASAKHWLRRNKAVLAGEEPEKTSVETASVDVGETSTPKRAMPRSKPIK